MQSRLDHIAETNADVRVILRERANHQREIQRLDGELAKARAEIEKLRAKLHDRCACEVGS